MTQALRCRWWHPPLLAVQFLTRLPVPGLDGIPEAEAQQALRRAPIWFPLVGTLIGCLTAGLLVSADLLWPLPVAVLIALAFEAWLTGAFHEDAVADFCDAMGGGRDREHTMRIMKDSRIGSYGTLGLVLAVGLRAALLMTIPVPLLVPALIASACFGRTLAVAAMICIPTPQGSQGLAAKLGHQAHLSLSWVTLTAVPGLLPLGVLAPSSLGLAMAASIPFFVWFRRLLLRRLGGVTGDGLGFAAYAGQLILLLAAAAA